MGTGLRKATWYVYIQLCVIAYGLMVVIEFGSPWGVSGLNACYEAEALD